ncbi:MAG: glycosyltransferase, partial [Clostridiales bacterium]|nr:glycosyltransferase [Clostridiales bacterium]
SINFFFNFLLDFIPLDFSIKPLRLATTVGVICALIGFLYGVVIIIQRLVRPVYAAGYSSIMAGMLFIGGMIMIMLGIIGEYIGRIYICINKAPQYVVRKTYNVEKDAPAEVG